MALSALTWKVGWLVALGSLCSWALAGHWPSSKTPWACALPELRRAPQDYVRCGEGAPLLPDQLWLLGLKADLNTAEPNTLKNLPKIPSKVLSGLMEERARVGGFCEWEEVAKVSGIGAVRLNSLQEHLFIQCGEKR